MLSVGVSIWVLVKGYQRLLSGTCTYLDSDYLSSYRDHVSCDLSPFLLNVILDELSFSIRDLYEQSFVALCADRGGQRASGVSSECVERVD